MPDNEQLDTAISNINDIRETSKDSTVLLNQIESDLTELNQHVTNIDEYIILQIEEKKKNEQESKKVDEKKEETRAEDTKAGEQEQQTITIAEVYAETIKVNDNLKTTNNLLTVNVFSSGILAGVLLFTLLWNRVFK